MPAPKENTYAVGNTGGRPRKVDTEDLPQFGRDMVKWFENHLENLSELKTVPFIENYARQHGLSTDTLKRYSDENEEFCGAYKQCKQIQKEILIQGGLRGYFNPTAYIFTAKNIAGMRDKFEVEESNAKRLIILDQ